MGETGRQDEDKEKKQQKKTTEEGDRGGELVPSVVQHGRLNVLHRPSSKTRHHQKHTTTAECVCVILTIRSGDDLVVVVVVLVPTQFKVSPVEIVTEGTKATRLC